MNTEEPETVSQATVVVEFLDKYFSFVILYKLAKFNCQTLFHILRHLMTSQNLKV